MNLKRRLEKLEQWAGVGAKSIIDLPPEKFQKWLAGSTFEEREQVAEMLEEKIGDPPYRSIEQMTPNEILEELALNNRFLALLHYEENPEAALKIVGPEEGLSSAEFQEAWAALGLGFSEEGEESVAARLENSGPNLNTCPLLAVMQKEEESNEQGQSLARGAPGCAGGTAVPGRVSGDSLGDGEAAVGAARDHL